MSFINLLKINNISPSQLEPNTNILTVNNLNLTNTVNNYVSATTFSSDNVNFNNFYIDNFTGTLLTMTNLSVNNSFTGESLRRNTNITNLGLVVSNFTGTNAVCTNNFFIDANATTKFFRFEHCYILSGTYDSSTTALAQNKNITYTNASFSTINQALAGCLLNTDNATFTTVNLTTTANFNNITTTTATFGTTALTNTCNNISCTNISYTGNFIRFRLNSITNLSCSLLSASAIVNPTILNRLDIVNLSSTIMSSVNANVTLYSTTGATSGNILNGRVNNVSYTNSTATNVTVSEPLAFVNFTNFTATNFTCTTLSVTNLTCTRFTCTSFNSTNLGVISMTALRLAAEVTGFNNSQTNQGNYNWIKNGGGSFGWGVNVGYVLPNNSFNFTMYVPGNIYCGTELNITSSKLVKKLLYDINKNKNELESLKRKLTDIDFYLYDYIDKSKDYFDHYGFIAEEVEKQFPEFVFYNNKTKEYIPNVYKTIKLVEKDENLVFENINLDVGDKLLILQNNEKFETTFENINNDIKIENKYKDFLNKDIFVYGSNDYALKIQKNALFELSCVITKDLIEELIDIENKITDLYELQNQIENLIAI